MSEPLDPRDHIEKLILACEIAGSVLEPAIDRTWLLRDPLHRAVQATIDSLTAQAKPVDIFAVEQHFTQPQRAINIHAWLRLLPLAIRERGDDAFDDNLPALVATLKRLEQRRTDGVGMTPANAIPPEAIRWLWDGWLARGKLHLLAGSVGSGKTTLALSLAATISAGGLFPDGTRAQAGHVLFWSGEDDPADSLVPRFLACGGDPDRLVFARDVCSRGKVSPFHPARDMSVLAKAMIDMPDLSVLIIDPIASAVAGDTDKNAATRRSLTALVELAAARNIAVLGIGHFGKMRQSRHPLSRVLGAHAFIAVTRLIMVTAKGADGIPLLVRAKSNIGPDGDGFAYTLEREEVAPGIVGQKIVWADPVTGAAHDLMREEESDVTSASPQRLAARHWLIGQLGSGGARVADLMAAAPLVGHSWGTVLRAKRPLGIRPVQLREGGWFWNLPHPAVESGAGENTVLA